MNAVGVQLVLDFAVSDAAAVLRAGEQAQPARAADLRAAGLWTLERAALEAVLANGVADGQGLELDDMTTGRLDFTDPYNGQPPTLAEQVGLAVLSLADGADKLDPDTLLDALAQSTIPERVADVVAELRADGE